MKVIFYTYAYNAEKTIARTIESIIVQTHHDWIYYCLDNGSTDCTGSIIREYSAKDSRITILVNKENKVFEKGNDWWQIMWNTEEGDYFCWIDADDEYKPDFLEKILPFIEKNNLDIAVGGNDFIDFKTNQLISARKLFDDLILEREGFGLHFPLYYQFVRTWWGKLIKLSVMRKYNFKHCPNVMYGYDTIWSMENFRNASRVGIYADSFYKYYVNPKSASYKWDDKRIESDRILHDTAKNFLIDKVGFISPQNREFLFWVYFNAIKDTLNVLLNAKISVFEKLTGLSDIFTSSQTRELADLSFLFYLQLNHEKIVLFKEITEWILSKKETRSDYGFETASDVFTVIKVIPANFNGWSNSEIFALLVKTRVKSKVVELSSKLELQIVEIAHRQPLLNGFNADFFVFFSNIIIEILNKNFENAVKLILSCIEEEREVPAGSSIPLVTLGLNLSAKTELMNDFIFFKKLQVSLFIDSGQKDVAAAELIEWLELMPDDEDFIELGKKVQ